LENGKELKIVRDNMPFGRVGEKEFGTYFIGYARSPRRSSKCWRICSWGVLPAIMTGC
jgi:deferrochelatase/peroxidase EfeB